MSNKIQGVIQYLNEKDGDWGKSYNVKIDGETYYLKGKYPPRGIAKGDTVELEYELQGNYKKVPVGGIRKIDGAIAPPSKPSSGGAPSKPAANVSSYGDRQDVISKQAALNTALAFLEFAAKSEALPTPKSKAQGFGYLKQLWLEEAAFLYNLNTGNDWDIAEAADVKEEAPKPVKKAPAKKAVAPAPAEEEFEDDVIPFEDGEAEDDQW